MDDVDERKGPAINLQRIEDRIAADEPGPDIVAHPGLRPFGDKHDVAAAIGEINFPAGDHVNSKLRDRLSEQLCASRHRRPLLQFSMEAESVQRLGSLRHSTCPWRPTRLTGPLFLI